MSTPTIKRDLYRLPCPLCGKKSKSVVSMDAKERLFAYSHCCSTRIFGEDGVVLYTRRVHKEIHPSNWSRDKIVSYIKQHPAGTEEDV